MKLILRFTVLLIWISGSGCLKDNAYNDGSIQSTRSQGNDPKIIEIKLTATSSSNVINYSYPNSNNDTVVDFVLVNVATPGPAPEDLHVTLAENDQLITDYNAANTDTTVSASNPFPTGVVTDYSVLTGFTVVNPGGVVTIPKGQQSGMLQIKLKPSDYVGKTYALGFTIKSVQEPGYTISGNNQNGIGIVNIKNQYDGTYECKGTRIHPVLGTFSFDYKANMGTSSANSIDGNALADLVQDLSITVNPDNTVSLSSTYATVLLQPGKVNSYDPASKTFTLNYYYNSAAPRLISETLVKQ